MADRVAFTPPPPPPPPQGQPGKHLRLCPLSVVLPGGA